MLDWPCPHSSFRCAWTRLVAELGRTGLVAELGRTRQRTPWVSFTGARLWHACFPHYTVGGLRPSVAKRTASVAKCEAGRRGRDWVRRGTQLLFRHTSSTIILGFANVRPCWIRWTARCSLLRLCCTRVEGEPAAMHANPHLGHFCCKSIQLQSLLQRSLSQSLRRYSRHYILIPETRQHKIHGKYGY